MNIKTLITIFIYELNNCYSFPIKNFFYRAKFNLNYHNFDIYSNDNDEVSNFNHEDNDLIVKSIMSCSHNYGTLSTIVNNKQINNYPYNSIVPFTLNKNGYPIFYLSKIAKHTHNIKENKKVSLMVSEIGLLNSQDNRVCFIGNIRKVNDNEIKTNKNYFYKSHANNPLLSLEGFDFYIIDDIKLIYFIGGFGNTQKINITKYFNAQADNIYVNSLICKYSIQHKYTFVLESLKNYLWKEYNIKNGKHYEIFEIKNFDKKGINIRLIRKNSSTFIKKIYFRKDIFSIPELVNEIKYIHNIY